MKVVITFLLVYGIAWRLLFVVIDVMKIRAEAKQHRLEWQKHRRKIKPQ